MKRTHLDNISVTYATDVKPEDIVNGVHKQDMQNLDMTMMAFAYERLKQFKANVPESELKDAVVDLGGDNKRSLSVILSSLITLAEKVLANKDLTDPGVEHNYDEQDQFWIIWAKAYSYFWSF